MTRITGDNTATNNAMKTTAPRSADFHDAISQFHETNAMNMYVIMAAAVVMINVCFMLLCV